MRKLFLLAAALLAVPFAAQAQTSNGRVTTAAPTYGNATTAPFSLTTGGGLRVDIASIAATLGIVGSTAHDAAGAAVPPVAAGCYASAAAPSDVSADNDVTRAWCLRNGARASVLTAAGALIGGDATNGLDVDVTRLSALVAGSAVIGKVGIDQTTPGTTNLVQITDGSGAVNVIIDSSATLTVNSHAVTVASGGIASGAVASGAIATGAYASGSIGSGAVASGAIASGAYASGSIGSGAIASGAVASGAYASGSISAGAIAAGASSLVKLEDVASADADAGVPAMCTRKATAANVSGTDGDYEFLQCSAGRLWTDTQLSAETTKVIGTVRVQGNVGGVLDAVQAAAIPANAVAIGYRSDQGLAAGTAGLTTPIICQDSVAIDTASSGNVELVALTSSETIYVCGWSVVATTAVAVQFIYGTGTACATGETNLTGAMPLAANGGIVQQSPYAFTKAAVSNAFCIELSGAVQVSGIVNYTKF